MKAVDVADLCNFMARYMEFGPSEVVEQNMWNMALNMARSFHLSAVIFMLHAIRIARVTFEAWYSWCLLAGAKSACVECGDHRVPWNDGFESKCIPFIAAAFHCDCIYMGPLGPAESCKSIGRNACEKE